MAGEKGSKVLKAAQKRTIRLGHKGRGPKAPVTKELLRALVAWLEAEAAGDERKAPLYDRDACWATLGFYGLLRRGELGSLRMEDVVVDKERKRVKVFIRKSKTDVGMGAWVWLAWDTKSGTKIGETVRRWVEYRRRQGATARDALFTAWDKDKQEMTGRAVDVKGQAMAKQLKKHLKDMSEAFHMNLKVDQYGSHSLRRGGANAMKEAGWPPERIQEHGRWTSDCYKRYLERGAGERLEVTREM